MLHIRPLAMHEVPLLREFPPAHWNVDLPALFGMHFGQPYFHPFAAEWDGVLVGCANGLTNGPAGWLGNIIVLPQWRGRGIGAALTQRVVEQLRASGVSHQILIATSLGEPVYRKLGFEIAAEYVFFDRASGSPPPDGGPAVRRARHADEAAILALDLLVTGEDRAPFLRRLLGDAWVHASSAGEVDGYFLPQLGTGPVIATHDEAGLALVLHKLSRGARSCVVPAGNPAAAAYLRSQGFVETSRAPRMVLGGDVRWQPARVYCRGSGYCG